MSNENLLQLCTIFYDYSAENNTTIDFHIHNRLTAMICVLHKKQFFFSFSFFVSILVATFHFHESFVLIPSHHSLMSMHQ